jgi:flagellar basal-body rod protein FlgG
MSFQHGLSGLAAAAKNLDVIGNNVANANTVGAKASRTEFADLYANSTSGSGGASAGTGVAVSGIAQQFGQGDIVSTTNPLDMAINGRGFFQVLLPDGTEAYTRDGSFQINAQGELVTNSGYTIQPGIQIPEGAQAISIGSDGTVTVQIAGQAAPQEVGQITLTDFVNPSGLFAKGENLFLESGASGPAQAGTPGQAGIGLLGQGSLESSNVNTVEELVAMIETQRAYEINAKAISTTDQMLAYLNNNV